MKKFGKFTEYDPAERLGGKAVHIRTEEGVDWYDVVGTFEADTYKLSLADDNQVVGAERDASMLWPAGLSVVEVPFDSFPADYQTQFRAGVRYYYSPEDGSVKVRVSRAVAQATIERSTRLKAVNKLILELQDINEVGEPTDAQRQRYIDLRLYRAALLSIDPNQVPVQFPEPPLVKETT